MQSEIYAEVKQRLTMEQVLERYGHRVHHNKALCPFHNDSKPSLTVYSNSFYCFVCGTGGDVITFVAKLHHISNHEAAAQLNSDFNLHIDMDAKPNFRAVIQREQQEQKHKEFERWRHDAFIILSMYRRTLWFARQNPGEELFQESLQNLETMDYYLDCLQDEPQEFYKTDRQVVTNIDRRIHQFSNSGNDTG